MSSATSTTTEMVKSGGHFMVSVLAFAMVFLNIGAAVCGVLLLMDVMKLKDEKSTRSAKDTKEIIDRMFIYAIVIIVAIVFALLSKLGAVFYGRRK